MTEERETELVTGTVGGIIQKATDKWQIEVTPPGSQYSKKLWTKSETQVALATGLIGQTATFECGVSHWTTNDGKPVRSLWVNAINPGTPPPSQAAATARHTPAGDPRQESIERQVALKAAVDFWAGSTQDTDTVIAAAEQFDKFLAASRATTAPVSDLQPDNPPEYHGDDDVPF